MAKNLKHIFRTELILQRKRGKKVSRNTIKKDTNGKYADYTRIYSDKSYATHLGRSKQFADYCKSQNIKNLKQITPEFAQKYLIYQRNRGLSASTIGSDALMINHILIGSGIWKEQQKLQKAKISGMPKRSMLISKQREKSLTSLEWRQRYPNKYEKYRAQIDTIRAFGFRRRELVGGTSRKGKDGLGNLSLYKFKDETLRAITQGKGGKVRWTVCRKDMQAEMEQFYSSIIRPEAFRPRSKADFQRNLKENKPFFHPFSHQVPAHIFRAEYAQNMIQELANHHYSGRRSYFYYKKIKSETTGKFQYIKTTRYHDLNSLYQVGEYRASYGAFYQLTDYLGHNRIDVLNAYLGIGRG